MGAMVDFQDVDVVRGAGEWSGVWKVRRRRESEAVAGRKWAKTEMNGWMQAKVRDRSPVRSIVCNWHRLVCVLIFGGHVRWGECVAFQMPFALLSIRSETNSKLLTTQLLLIMKIISFAVID